MAGARAWHKDKENIELTPAGARNACQSVDQNVDQRAAELEKSEPTPTPDVPLLDEKTVADITVAFVFDRKHTSDRILVCTWNPEDLFQPEYVGKDIWVVKKEGHEPGCTFIVHDKEGRVVMSQ